MYENIGQGDALGLGNVGAFASNSYWSSTEYDNIDAWVQDFGYGDQYNGYKDVTYRSVRAVRTF
jgi:hypothetical protein